MTAPRMQTVRGSRLARRRAMAIGAAGLVACAAPSALASDTQPPPWLHVPLNASKPRTQYSAQPAPAAAAEDGDDHFLHARAESAASVAVQRDPVDLATRPFVTWRWLIRTQPDQPDISTAAREDAAARLIFFFDGDRDRLPWTDRLVMATADRLGSRPLPFATLMYVSAPGRAVGELLSNPYTRRVRMIVVDATQPTPDPAWRAFGRNLREDYRRAFGAEPGRLLGWGLMTDSDNTHSRAEAVYGPVRFRPAP